MSARETCLTHHLSEMMQTKYNNPKQRQHIARRSIDQNHAFDVIL